MKIKLTILIAFLMGGMITVATAQRLQPGFQAEEYMELLRLSARQADSPWTKVKLAPPRNARMVYRSPEAGLVNRWDLWIKDDSIAVISIRGTNGTATSWMENFYAAMIPATGTLQLNDSTRFSYRLAKDERATVHAGWALGMASMAPGITGKILEYYRKGIHEFIIAGHSQGGAIAFLLRSYLQYREDLPKDIVYKTYCSAAPKPGNLYYAYDFDFITRNGWGLRVVNARDWVPETPFSIQTTSDFNAVNPFTDIKGAIRSRPLLVKAALGYMYGRLDRPTKKASRRMKRILGKLVYKQVKKVLPQYQQPDFSNSNNYMLAGTPVVLYPVDDYDHHFPFDGKNVFIHHMFEPYAWLTGKIYGVDAR